MTPPLPQAWSDLSAAAISEDAVSQLHQPAENFKLYINDVEAGQSGSIKAGHALTLYVLQGACVLDIDGASVPLNAAQVIHLDAGSYQCTAGCDGVRMVKVFSRI